MTQHFDKMEGRIRASLEIGRIWHLRASTRRGSRLFIWYGEGNEEMFEVYDLNTGECLAGDFGGKHATYDVEQLADQLMRGETVTFHETGEGVFHVPENRLSLRAKASSGSAESSPGTGDEDFDRCGCDPKHHKLVNKENEDWTTFFDYKCQKCGRFWTESTES